MEFIIGVVLIVAWVWMVVIAFSEDEKIWAIAMMVFLPVCFIYGIRRFDAAAIPMIMFVASFALVFFTMDLSSPELAAANQ